MRIPDSIKLQYLRGAMRAANPVKEGPGEAQPTPKEDFDVMDPTMGSIHEALNRAGTPFENERLRLLLAYLQQAANAAASIGAHDLGCVLVALETATYYGDAILDDRGRRGTMLSVANGYLEDKSEDVIGGKNRPSFVRRIAERFTPKPKDDDVADATGRAKGLVLWLDDVAAQAETLLGQPQEEWWLKVVEECVRTCQRVTRHDAKDESNYARAVLRGWGLSEERARDVVKAAGL